MCAAILLCFVASLAAPALAIPAPRSKLMRSEFRFETSGFTNAQPMATATVNIRNIRSSDYVYSTVLIVAQVTGTFSTVVYQIDSGTQRSMSRVGSTNRYQASWDTTAVSAGTHTLYVKAKSSSGTVVGSASVSVNVVTNYKWELYYEIDYMNGHTPPASMLTYITNYWKGHAVKFNYQLDDVVTDPTPGDGYISDNDFWSIENSYNNVWMYDDRSHGGASPQYFLKEKWMLYGSWYSSSNVGGYTYVSVSGSDLLAGNYIFIADSMVDNWEASLGITNEGGEIIVTAHECGHSIGIAKLSGGYEVYDSDYYSIMSSMRTQNAKSMSGYWYYSKEYWATYNMGYYLI